MNIFFLDPDPALNAQFYLDCHQKIILEIAQMLCTGKRLLEGGYCENPLVLQGPHNTIKKTRWPLEEEISGGPLYYRETHVAHPMSRWVRQSKQNYLWTIDIGENLVWEFNYRFGKRHKSASMIYQCMANMPNNFPNLKSTNPPLCMPSQFKRDNLYDSYRTYYREGKVKNLKKKWTKRERPSWL